MPQPIYYVKQTSYAGVTMNIEEEKKKIELFIKTGLVVLSLLMFVGVVATTIKKVVTVTSIKNERRLPIYCVDTEEKKVALSFDAAWGNDDTKEILAILKKNDIRVTFFMTGGWVREYPDDVKAIAAAGHDLGNHSESHKQMSQLTEEECRREIKLVHDEVQQLTGVSMKLFRPPFGDYNNTLIDTANDMGYQCIQWDVDSLDWKNYGVNSIIDTILNHPHLGNGSIILCHNGAKYTKDALEVIISGLKDQGYTIVPVSELIYSKSHRLDQEGRQYKEQEK